MATHELYDPGADGIEPTPDEIHANAYLAFMEGIVLRDVETLHWAGNIIEETGYPLADCVAQSASTLEDAIHGGDDGRLAEVIDFSFADAVRSYVYSGLEIDVSTLSLCADLLKYSKSELSQIVFPEYNLPYLLDMNEASPVALADMRYYGRRTMIQLGLGSVSMKVTHKLGLRL